MEIIPPTWNKKLSTSILATWRKAHQLLTDANQVRILGYSLPVTDAYIKYLLKSAGANAANLKRIDILCKDSSGTVQQCYKDFVTFNSMRFKNCRIEDYLHLIL